MKLILIFSLLFFLSSHLLITDMSYAQGDEVEEEFFEEDEEYDEEFDEEPGAEETISETNKEPAVEKVEESTSNVESEVSEAENQVGEEDEFSDFSEEQFEDETNPSEDEFAEFDDEKPEPVEQEEQAEQVAEPEPADEEGIFEEEEVVEAAAVPAPISAPFVSVEDIRFVSSDQGGSIVIKTSQQALYSVREKSDTQQLVVDIKNASMPESLKRPYILKEFTDTPFAMINAYQNLGAGTARIVVQLKPGESAMVSQEGSEIILIPEVRTTKVTKDMQPKTSEATLVSEFTTADEDGVHTNVGIAKANQKKEASILGARSLEEFLTQNYTFYGDPISIQVNNADVRDVLNFISEQTGINLVISGEVKGTISLKLRQVPWDQALVLIMKSRRLGYVRQGNVIRIASLKQLENEAKSAKSILEAQQELSPLIVKVIPVSFADAKDMVTQVGAFLSNGRGKVVYDERSNSLIVTDTREVLNKISQLVNELDFAPPQVMIEGKIVEALEEFRKTIGLRWGAQGGAVTLSSSKGLNGGPIDLSPTIGVSPIDADTANGAIGSFGFNIGTLDFLGDLTATLALAETDNIVKILSSPRIVTMNKTKAEIVQKSENVSFSTTVDTDTNVTTRTVQRDPFEVRMTVTPQITNDGSIIMDFEVKRDFLGAVIDTSTNAKAKNSREAKTSVLVKNGQTAVVGGIFQTDQSVNNAGVPGLRNIPVIGWLFKSKVTEKIKNELLIFLTPRILKADKLVEAKKDKGPGY